MLLLIACGNTLRQDDGAGLVLAQQLATAWRAQGVPVRYLPVHQLMPELALEIAAAEVRQVWFVDSRIAADGADTAVKFTPVDARSADAIAASPSLGHQMSPELLLLWARLLFDDRPAQVQPTAWQITVPGFEFAHSETLSLACQAVLETALDQVQEQSEALVSA